MPARIRFLTIEERKFRRAQSRLKTSLGCLYNEAIHSPCWPPVCHRFAAANLGQGTLRSMAWLTSAKALSWAICDCALHEWFC